MRKFILFVALMMSTVFSAFAQRAIEQPKTIFDNLYVGASVGAATPLKMSEILPINPFAEVRVGKEITATYAVEVSGQVVFGSHAADGTRFSLHQWVRGTNLGVNGTVNLNNVFGTFDGKRGKFEVLAVLGLGWAHTFNNELYGADENAFTIRTGLEGRVNFSEALALSIKPSVLWANSGHGGFKFSSNRALLGVSVGLVYHFKNANGTHNFKTYDIGVLNDEINRLRGALAECEGREPQIIERTKTIEIPVEVQQPIVPKNTLWVVSFEKASYKLTNEAKSVLDSIKDVNVVKIVATASPEGTKRFNDKLSQNRANAVKEYLTSKGINVDSAIGLGVQNNASQRVAIVTIAE